MLMLLGTVLHLADETPQAEDVKAGWVALVLFLLLIAALVFLIFSFLKQLRKAQAAKEAGVYGDRPVEAEEQDGDEPAEHDEPVDHED